MTMADRIVAMNEGVAQQVGPPAELYDDPANTFVAGFIGSPAMNFLDGTLTRDEGTTTVRVGDVVLAEVEAPAGMASGFFGIGGGFLVVPCLLYATRMPMIDAVGSSLLAVAAFSVATAANYARSGLIAWGIAAWFITGGLAGGFAGLRCATGLCAQKNRLRRVFAFVIFAVAAYIFYRSYGLVA